jgi:hypothetical protein
MLIKAAGTASVLPMAVSRTGWGDWKNPQQAARDGNGKTPQESQNESLHIFSNNHKKVA